MKVVVKRFDVFQTAKVTSAMYGCFAVMSLLFPTLTMVSAQGVAGIGLLIWLPLFPIIGFFAGGIFAFIYNFFSERFIGGFKLELEVESHEMPAGQE